MTKRNTILKKLTFIFTVSFMIITMCIPVFAASNCLHKGCTRKPVPGPNRDGYCYEHSPKNQAVKCSEKGCTNNAYHGSKYCSFHECGATSCKSKKAPNSGFCYSHASYDEVLRKHNSSSAKKTKKSSSSKRKMPDCDDYDSYEDFMDDWDGFMPDGSDAEDYWENW